MTFGDLLLDKGDGFSRVETFRAGLGTIHDSVTTVQLKGVVERFKTFLGEFVS
jgi:hypothetical protein